MQPAMAKHIEQTKGICGGKPRIAGTRIRVQDIVLLTEQGNSPDEIVSGYPHLSLSAVHAALSFYHDNQDLIDQQIRESKEFVVNFKESSPGPTKLAPGDTVSS
jgi:uncharacterized protein (DUF433 family)